MPTFCVSLLYIFLHPSTNSLHDNAFDIHPAVAQDFGQYLRKNLSILIHSASDESPPNS